MTDNSTRSSIVALYEEAWQLEKKTLSIDSSRTPSQIYLSREILQILMELQDDYHSDGYSVSTKFKQKKLNQIEKYTKKLTTVEHADILTDSRNRSIFLLLISIPSKATTNCVQHLISLNCNIDSVDYRGRNAAHIACECGNCSVLRLLFKNNANLTLKDNSSEQLTPLHAALDILICSENNVNATNTHTYHKIVALCTKYALLQGQDLVNDKLGNANGGSWNFESSQSIMDIADKNIQVLSVITEGYNNCNTFRKKVYEILMKFEGGCNRCIVDIIWFFMYCCVPKLDLNVKLKKAQQVLQKERQEKRESMRRLSTKGQKGKRKK